MRKLLLKEKTPVKSKIWSDEIFWNGNKWCVRCVKRCDPVVIDEEKVKEEKGKKVRLSYKAACAEIKEYIEGYLAERGLSHIGVRVCRVDTDSISVEIDMVELEIYFSFASYVSRDFSALTAKELRLRFLKNEILIGRSIVRRIRNAIRKQGVVACSEYDEILALQDLV